MAQEVITSSLNVRTIEMGREKRMRSSRLDALEIIYSQTINLSSVRIDFDENGRVLRIGSQPQFEKVAANPVIRGYSVSMEWPQPA